MIFFDTIYKVLVNLNQQLDCLLEIVDNLDFLFIYFQLMKKLGLHTNNLHLIVNINIINLIQKNLGHQRLLGKFKNHHYKLHQLSCIFENIGNICKLLIEMIWPYFLFYFENIRIFQFQNLIINLKNLNLIYKY